MESTIFVKKLRQTLQAQSIKDEKAYIFLRTTLKPSTWELDLVDSVSGSSYNGIVTDAELEENAAELEICKILYREECLEALTKYDIGHFHYTIERNDENTIFKLIKKSGFDILYLDVELSEGPKPIDLLRTCIGIIREKERFLEKPREVLVNPKDSAEYKELHSQYIAELTEMQRKQMKAKRSFAALYKQKKNKIRQLQKQLRDAMRP